MKLLNRIATFPVLTELCMVTSAWGHGCDQQDSPACECADAVCYSPSPWTGGDFGCNCQWVMFLFTGSVVALSQLSADTMTRQSNWHLDWQTHTYTGTYVPCSLGQTCASHRRAILEGRILEKQSCNRLMPLGKRCCGGNESAPALSHIQLSVKGTACQRWHSCNSEDAAVQKGHDDFFKSGLLLIKALRSDTHKSHTHLVTLQETSVTADLS